MVRPLLACKMEKTFVDHYLLEDYGTLVSQYSNMERLP